MTPYCPQCGHTNLHAGFACHAWPSGTYPDGRERWMSCQGCDSAINYYCICKYDDEVEIDGVIRYREPACQCDWDYTHGFNPNNPRFAREQKSRPPWLAPEPEWANGSIVKHPDVEWYWESQEREVDSQK